MTKKILAIAAVCGSLFGAALALPAHAQTYRYDTPTVGAQSTPVPVARAYVVIEQPAVQAPEPSATSRDNEGRPTQGALGTGDADREMALTQDYSPSRRNRIERY